MHYNFNENEVVVVLGHLGHSQGPYVVEKCNGNVLVAKRRSDGYERTWSNRTGVEKDRYSDRYRTARVVPVAQFERDEAKKVQEKNERIDQLWLDAYLNLTEKNIDGVIAIMNQLKRIN